MHAKNKKASLPSLVSIKEQEKSRDALNSSHISKPSAPDKWSTYNRDDQSPTPDITFDQ